MSMDLRVNDSAMVYKFKRTERQWIGSFRPHAETVLWASAIVRVRREKQDGSFRARALYIVRVKALK